LAETPALHKVDRLEAGQALMNLMAAVLAVEE
jgi:hypothetical protein